MWKYLVTFLQICPSTEVIFYIHTYTLYSCKYIKYYSRDILYVYIYTGICDIYIILYRCVDRYQCMRIFSSGHIQETDFWPPHQTRQNALPDAGDFGLFASHEGHAACGAEERPGLFAILGWVPRIRPLGETKKSLERWKRGIFQCFMVVIWKRNVSFGGFEVMWFSRYINANKKRNSSNGD
jgi:hypothetical protein